MKKTTSRPASEAYVKRIAKLANTVAGKMSWEYRMSTELMRGILPPSPASAPVYSLSTANLHYGVLKAIDGGINLRGRTFDQMDFTRNTPTREELELLKKRFTLTSVIANRLWHIAKAFHRLQNTSISKSGTL